MPDPRQPSKQSLEPGQFAAPTPGAVRPDPDTPFRADHQLILDNLREAIFTLDREGCIRTANAAATSLFGLAAAAWPGTPVHQLHLNLEAARRFEELHAPALRRDGVAEGEYLMRGARGLAFPAEVRMVILRDHDHQTTGRVLVIRDITHRKNNEEQVRNRTRQLMVLYEVGTLVNRSLDLDQLLSTALRRLRSILECDVAGFYLAVGPDADPRLQFYQGSGFTPDQVAAERTRAGARDLSEPARRAAISRQLVFIEDLQRAGEIQAPLLRESGVHSTAYVPIETKGRLVGVLALGRRRLQPFAGETVDLLLPLGQLIATATNNARLVAGLKNLNEQLLALHELSTLLASSVSERKALRATLGAVAGSLECPVALFFAPREDQAVLQAQVAEGLSETLRAQILRSAAVALATDSTHPVARAFITVGLVEGRWPGNHASRWMHLLRRQGLQSVIAAPIPHQGNALGVVTLFAPGCRTLDENERRLLHVALRQVGAAIANARLIADVRRHRMSLAKLSSRILSAQEEERRHLSRELHDGIGQSLSALKLDLELLNAGKQRLPAAVRGNLERILLVVGETIAELRRIAHDLRPSILDDLGLVPTLRWFVQRFQEQTGIPVEIHLAGEIGGLSPQQDVNLYRIVQEGLSNVVKHARARSVELRLQRLDGSLRLSILDDGLGVEPATALAQSAKAGLGLVGIRERVHLMGGRFRLRRRPGGGSIVAVQVPLAGGIPSGPHPASSSREDE